MKSFIAILALLLLASGLLVWRMMRTSTSWTYVVEADLSPALGGALDPRDPPSARQARLRADVLRSLPATGFPAEEVLRISVQFRSEQRKFRWTWPPLGIVRTGEIIRTTRLYWRADRPPGWTVGGISPDESTPMTREQAVERLIQLTDAALQAP